MGGQLRHKAIEPGAKPNCPLLGNLCPAMGARGQGDRYHGIRRTGGGAGHGGS